jgi:hypothetical protein
LGAGNAELAEALQASGVHTDRERRVDHLNIDLAVGRFAIEVHRSGRNPFTRGGREHERVVHLMDQGFHVAYVWAAPGSVSCGFDPAACAEHLVTWMQAAGGDPASPCEYRVIRGCGKLAASGRGHPDEMTFKAAPHRHRDTA